MPIWEPLPKVGESDMEWTIDDLAQAAFDNARHHGFWENGINVDRGIALMHSELSEAYEEYRQHPDHLTHFYFNETKPGKPEGFAMELADTVIRIADWFRALGLDMAECIRLKHEYNITRPYKHGKAF